MSKIYILVGGTSTSGVYLKTRYFSSEELAIKELDKLHKAAEILNQDNWTFSIKEIILDV